MIDTKQVIVLIFLDKGSITNSVKYKQKEDIFKKSFFKNFASKLKKKLGNENQNNEKIQKQIEKILTKKFDKKISMIEDKIIPNKQLQKKLTFFRAKTKFGVSFPNSHHDQKHSKVNSNNQSYYSPLKYNNSNNMSNFRSKFLQLESCEEIGEEDEEYYSNHTTERKIITPNTNGSQFSDSQVIKFTNTFKSFPNNTLILDYKFNYGPSNQTSNVFTYDKKGSFGSSRKINPINYNDESFV